VSSRTSDAFFTVDGESLVPTPMAQGPWGATVSGHILGGLAGWAVEQGVTDPDLQPARLTVDMMRPTLMEPVRVHTETRREGRRIMVVDADITQHDQLVCRATSVFLRRGEHPDGQVWAPAASMPPVPDTPPTIPDNMPFELWAYGVDTQHGALGGTHTEWQQAHSRRYAWVREVRPLIDGQEMSPFTRVALAADVTSALTHWGTGGLRFINADFTLSLSRLPDGEFVGLASDGHNGAAGVASGSATLFDRHGPIGHSIAVALGQPADAFRPPRHIGLT
jgi:acyl-coenzyme A thioesterase PaaI-like protein